MKPQAYQKPTIYNSDGTKAQIGTYDIRTDPLTNSTADGILDYINNNLDALHDKTDSLLTTNTTQTITADKTFTGAVNTTSLTVTGSTSVPTANADNNSNTVANTAFVKTAIANLVNGAPSQLDTLQELSAALGNDSNFSATVVNEIGEKVSKSGDTITGPILYDKTPNDDTELPNKAYVDAAINEALHDTSNYLPLAGGTLTGVVNGVTPPNGDNSKKLATTEFVNAKAGNYLPLSGGTLTGVVNGVTPTAGDNSTKIATTEFVNVKAGNYLPLKGGTLTGRIWFDSSEGGIGIASSQKDAGRLRLMGGNGYNKGAQLLLNGQSVSSNPGHFQLSATDTTNTASLYGFPDGRLTWDGQPLLPVGVVQAFAGTTIPSGWLLCDGSAVSRTTYANLYACIGTTYGAGNGSTTFNLPNLTDKFIQGSATAGTVKSAGLPNITGDIGFTVNFMQPTGAFGFATNKTCPAVSGNNANYNVNIDASRSSSIYGNSTTVQPPALTMRYIIKY